MIANMIWIIFIIESILKYLIIVITPWKTEQKINLSNYCINYSLKEQKKKQATGYINWDIICISKIKSSYKFENTALPKTRTLVSCNIRVPSWVVAFHDFASSTKSNPTSSVIPLIFQLLKGCPVLWVTCTSPLFANTARAFLKMLFANSWCSLRKMRLHYFPVMF